MMRWTHFRVVQVFDKVNCQIPIDVMPDNLNIHDTPLYSNRMTRGRVKICELCFICGFYVNLLSNLMSKCLDSTFPIDWMAIERNFFGDVFRMLFLKQRSNNVMMLPHNICAVVNDPF